MALLFNIDADLADADWPKQTDDVLVPTERSLGGPGSGNFGHKGRPGEVGGSSEGESAAAPLSTDEVSALADYVSGAAAATVGHQRVNGFLRHGKAAEGVEPIIAQIDAAIAKQPPLDSTNQVYRGVPIDVAQALAKLGPGGEFEDKGFVSTSRVHDVAEEFAKATRMGPKTGYGTISIRVPEGVSVLDVNKTLPKDRIWKDSEKEVLLPRGLRYRIDKVVKKDFAPSRSGLFSRFTFIVSVLPSSGSGRTTAAASSVDFPDGDPNASRYIWSLSDLIFHDSRHAGGPGSGNFGHGGRPGEVGGSAPGGGAAAPKAKGAKTKRREYNERNKSKQREYRKQRQEKIKQGLHVVKPRNAPPVPPAAAPAAPAPAVVPIVQPQTSMVAQPTPATPDQMAREQLLFDKTKSTDVLGGGVSDSYVVELENGQKGVFKPNFRPIAPVPDPGLMGKLQRAPHTQDIVSKGAKFLRPGITGQSAEREVAAWEVAKLVGMDDLVQPTILREVNTGTETLRGSFQAWADGSKVAAETQFPKMWDGPDDLQRTAMFDYIIGNQDRHMGNWMVNSQTGKLVLIDHGLSFGETKQGWGNRATLTRVADEAQRRSVPAPRDLTKPYVEKKSHIAAALHNLGLSQKAIDRVMQRIDIASKEYTWSNLARDRT